MNVKTTVALAFLLVVSVFGLYIVRTRPENSAGASPPQISPQGGASQTARKLIEDELEQVSNIVVKREGQNEPWTFERVATDEGPTGEWRMTTPLEAKALRWQVEGITRQLTGLQYELSYKAGEAGGVSAAQAGLDPPVATITLTDDDGKSVTVELGKAASSTTTYVRLANDDRVCVGKSDLKNLLKSRAIEYRDNQPWTFKPDAATRLAITTSADGTRTDYVFVPVGADWHMESPAVAKATSKVADAVRELSRLRITEWIDDDPGKLAIYGLDAPATTMRFTVQQTRESEPAEKETESSDTQEEKSKKAEPIVETFDYQLALSDRSPIGEETKVYVGVGDPPVVGTITRTNADKLKPVMSEWRDMSLISDDLTKATAINVTLGHESFALTRRDGQWFMGEGADRAEASAVSALLNTLNGLKATAFAEGSPDSLQTGLEKPNGVVSVTLPSRNEPIQFAIGEPTDGTTKLLTYVRAGDAGAVAKVRTTDLSRVTRGPLNYRDRTILNLPVGSIVRLELSVKMPFADAPHTFALGRSNSAWSMIEPVTAPVRREAVDALVSALSGLRADSVVGLGGQESAFGLHDPAVRATIVTEDDHRYTVLVTEHEGTTYARLEDGNAVYAIPGTILGQLRAELRSEAVLTFDAADVASFSVSEGGVVHTFQRSDGKWVYAAEPDLPLNAKKVEDLLLRVRDLKTERYVRYEDAPSASTLGLDQPERIISLKLLEGSTTVLKVSQQGGGTGAPPGRVASIDGQSGVFVLSNEMLSRVTLSLDELE